MMNKKIASVMLFALFLLSSCSAVPNTTTPSNSFFNNDFWTKVAIAGVSAVLSFLGSFLLNQVKQSKEPKQQLSYDLAITKGLISFAKNVENKVKVLYDGRDAENLFHVTCVIRNSGNTVIKNEFVRFAFSEGSQIVDFYQDPKPEREMGVDEVKENELAEFEKKYKIGHIESGQEVGFCFVVTSRKDFDVKLHPFNEQGGVAFLPRSVSRDADDYSLVKRFITLYLWFIFLPGIFNLIPYPIGDFASSIVRLAIFISMFPYITPFAKQIATVLFKLAYTKSVETQISIKNTQIDKMDIKTQASEKE